MAIDDYTRSLINGGTTDVTLRNGTTKRMRTDDFLTSEYNQPPSYPDYQDNTSSLPQGGDTVGNGVLGTFKDAVDAGFFNMLSGDAKFLADSFNTEFLNNMFGDKDSNGKAKRNSFSQWLDDKAKEYKGVALYNTTSQKELEQDNYKWWANAIGNAVGSSAPTMAAYAALSAINPMAGAGAAARGIMTMAPTASKVVQGSKSLATLSGYLGKLNSTGLGRLQLARMLDNVPEAMSEAGSAIDEMEEFNADVHKLPPSLFKQKYGDVPQREKTKEEFFAGKWGTLGLNIGLLTAADLAGNAGENLIMSKLGRNVTGDFTKKVAGETVNAAADTSWGTALKRAAAFAPLHAVKEGGEEFTQDIAKDIAMGRPIDWKQAWEEAKSGAAGGVFLGGAGGIVTTKTGGNNNSFDVEGEHFEISPNSEGGRTYRVGNREVSDIEFYDRLNSHVKDGQIGLVRGEDGKIDFDHKNYAGFDEETKKAYAEARYGLQHSKDGAQYADDVYNLEPTRTEVDETIKKWNEIKDNPELVNKRDQQEINEEINDARKTAAARIARTQDEVTAEAELEKVATGEKEYVDTNPELHKRVQQDTEYSKANGKEDGFFMSNLQFLYTENNGLTQEQKDYAQSILDRADLTDDEKRDAFNDNARYRWGRFVQNEQAQPQSTQAQSQANPSAQPNAQTVKTQPAAQPKVDAPAQAQSQAQVQAQAQSQEQPQAQASVQPSVEPSAQPAIQPTVEQKATPETAPKAEPKVEAKTEAKPATETKDATKQVKGFKKVIEGKDEDGRPTTTYKDGRYQAVVTKLEDNTYKVIKGNYNTKKGGYTNFLRGNYNTLEEATKFALERASDDYSRAEIDQAVSELDENQRMSSENIMYRVTERDDKNAVYSAQGLADSNSTGIEGKSQGKVTVTPVGITKGSRAVFNRLYNMVQKAANLKDVELKDFDAFEKYLAEQGYTDIHKNANGSMHCVDKDGVEHNYTGMKSDDGKSIFLNTDKFRLDSPVHEYGHVWWNLYFAPDDDGNPTQNKKEFEELKEILSQTRMYRELTDKNGPVYETYKDYQLEEAFCRLLGNYSLEAGYNPKFEEQVLGKSKNKFRRWLDNFFNKIRSFLGLEPNKQKTKGLIDFLNKPMGEILEAQDGEVSDALANTAKEVAETEVKSNNTEDEGEDINEGDVIVGEEEEAEEVIEETRANEEISPKEVNRQRRTLADDLVKSLSQENGRNLENLWNSLLADALKKGYISASEQKTIKDMFPKTTFLDNHVLNVEETESRDNAIEKVLQDILHENKSTKVYNAKNLLAKAVLVGEGADTKASFANEFANIESRRGAYKKVRQNWLTANAVQVGLITEAEAKALKEGQDAYKTLGVTEEQSKAAKIPLRITSKFDRYHKHQAKAVYAMEQAWKKGNSFMLTAGAGYGKSYVAMAEIDEILAAKPDAKILVIAGNQATLSSWRKAATHYRVGHDEVHGAKADNKYGFITGQDSNGKDIVTQTENGFTLCLYKTMQESKAISEQKWDYIFADESQNINSKEDGTSSARLETYQNIIGKGSKVAIISATPMPYVSNIGNNDYLWGGDKEGYKKLADAFNKEFEKLTTEEVELVVQGETELDEQGKPIVKKRESLLNAYKTLRDLGVITQPFTDKKSINDFFSGLNSGLPPALRAASALSFFQSYQKLKDSMEDYKEAEDRYMRLINGKQTRGAVYFTTKNGDKIYDRWKREASKLGIGGLKKYAQNVSNEMAQIRQQYETANVLFSKYQGEYSERDNNGFLKNNAEEMLRNKLRGLSSPLAKLNPTDKAKAFKAMNTLMIFEKNAYLLDEAINDGTYLLDGEHNALFNTQRIIVRRCQALNEALKSMGLVYGEESHAHAEALRRSFKLTEKNVPFHMIHTIKGINSFYDNILSKIPSVSKAFNKDDSKTVNSNDLKLVLEIVKGLVAADSIKKRLENSNEKFVVMGHFSDKKLTTNVFKLTATQLTTLAKEAHLTPAETRQLKADYAEWKSNNAAFLATIDRYVKAGDTYSMMKEALGPKYANVFQYFDSQNTKSKETIDAFRKGDVRVLYCTSRSASEGVSLDEVFDDKLELGRGNERRSMHKDAPRNLIFLDIPDRPALLEQAEARVLRSDTVNDVTIQYFTLGTEVENRGFNKYNTLGARTAALSRGKDASTDALNRLIDYNNALEEDRNLLTEEDYKNRPSLLRLNKDLDVEAIKKANEKYNAKKAGKDNSRASDMEHAAEFYARRERGRQSIARIKEARSLREAGNTAEAVRHLIFAPFDLEALGDRRGSYASLKDMKLYDLLATTAASDALDILGAQSVVFDVKNNKLLKNITDDDIETLANLVEKNAIVYETKKREYHAHTYGMIPTKLTAAKAKIVTILTGQPEINRATVTTLKKGDIDPAKLGLTPAQRDFVKSVLEKNEPFLKLENGNWYFKSFKSDTWGLMDVENAGKIAGIVEAVIKSRGLDDEAHLKLGTVDERLKAGYLAYDASGERNEANEQKYQFITQNFTPELLLDPSYKQIEDFFIETLQKEKDGDSALKEFNRIVEIEQKIFTDALVHNFDADELKEFGEQLEAYKKGKGKAPEMPELDYEAEDFGWSLDREEQRIRDEAQPKLTEIDDKIKALKAEKAGLVAKAMTPSQKAEASDRLNKQIKELQDEKGEIMQDISDRIDEIDDTNFENLDNWLNKWVDAKDFKSEGDGFSNAENLNDLLQAEIHRRIGYADIASLDSKVVAEAQREAERAAKQRQKDEARAEAAEKQNDKPVKTVPETQQQAQETQENEQKAKKKEPSARLDNVTLFKDLETGEVYYIRTEDNKEVRRIVSEVSYENAIKFGIAKQYQKNFRKFLDAWRTTYPAKYGNLDDATLTKLLVRQELNKKYPILNQVVLTYKKMAELFDTTKPFQNKMLFEGFKLNETNVGYVAELPNGNDAVIDTVNGAVISKGVRANEISVENAKKLALTDKERADFDKRIETLRTKNKDFSNKDEGEIILAVAGDNTPIGRLAKKIDKAAGLLADTVMNATGPNLERRLERASDERALSVNPESKNMNEPIVKRLLAGAKQMEKQGFSASDIFLSTRIWKDVDGGWRTWFNDNPNKLNIEALSKTPKSMKELYDMPALYKICPYLEKTTFALAELPAGCAARTSRKEDSIQIQAGYVAAINPDAYIDVGGKTLYIHNGFLFDGERLFKSADMLAIEFGANVSNNYFDNAVTANDFIKLWHKAGLGDEVKPTPSIKTSKLCKFFKKELLDSFFHEVQHVIQNNEGWAGGASAFYIENDIEREIKILKDLTDNSDSFDPIVYQDAFSNLNSLERTIKNIENKYGSIAAAYAKNIAPLQNDIRMADKLYQKLADKFARNRAAHSFISMAGIQDLKKRVSEASKASNELYKELQDDAKKLQSALDLARKTGDFDYLYKRVSGEQEARRAGAFGANNYKFLDAPVIKKELLDMLKKSPAYNSLSDNTKKILTEFAQTASLATSTASKLKEVNGKLSVGIDSIKGKAIAAKLYKRAREIKIANLGLLDRINVDKDSAIIRNSLKRLENIHDKVGRHSNARASEEVSSQSRNERAADEKSWSQGVHSQQGESTTDKIVALKNKDNRSKLGTDLYVAIVDKNHRLHKLDEWHSLLAGIKLTQDEEIYEAAQGSAASAAGLANALNEGNAESIKKINDKFELNGTDNQLVESGTLTNVLKLFMNAFKTKAGKDFMEEFTPEDDPNREVRAGGIYLTARMLYARALNWDQSYHDRVAMAIAQHKTPPPRVPYKMPPSLDEQKVRETLEKAGWVFKKEQDPKDANHFYYVKDDAASKDIFEEAGKAYTELNNNMQRFLCASGCLSRELRELLEGKKGDKNHVYEYYSPLMRDFTDTAAAESLYNSLSNGGSGMANVKLMLNRIDKAGSAKPLINPLEITTKAVAVAANRAIRNRVGLKTIQAMENVEKAQKRKIQDLPEELQLIKCIDRYVPKTYKVKDAQTGKIKTVKKMVLQEGIANPKECQFTVMIDGVRHTYETTREMYQAIVGYDSEMLGILSEIAMAPAQWLRKGSTLSPSFIIRNFCRDTIFASVSSRHGFKPILDSFKGGYKLLTDEKFRAEFEAAGIGQFNFYNDSSRIAKNLRDIMYDGKNYNYSKMVKEMAQGAYYLATFSQKRKGAAMVSRSTSYAVDTFVRLSELVESATRAGEYAKAKESAKANKEIIAQANKKLANAHAKIAAAQTMLSNAQAVNDTHRIAQAQKLLADLKNNGEMAKTFDSIVEAAAIQYASIAARNITLDFSRSGAEGRKYNRYVPFFNAAIQGSDKMWHLATDSNTAKRTWANMLVYVIAPTVALILAQYADDPEKRFKLNAGMRYSNWIIPNGTDNPFRIPKPQEVGALASLIEAFFDSMYLGNKSQMVKWARETWDVLLPEYIPTILTPMIEWRANYNFFSGRPVVATRLERLETEAQYTANTSETAKWLAKLADDTWLDNLIGVSPLKIDNTIRDWGGTMGFLGFELLGMLTPDFWNNKKPAKDFNERYPARDFFVNPNNYSEYLTEYYAMTKKMDQEANTHKPNPKLNRIRNIYGSNITKWNAEIRNIDEGKGKYANWTPEQKQDKMKELNIKVRDAARMAVLKYNPDYKEIADKAGIRTLY